jgi:hypothetical protein
MSNKRSSRADRQRRRQRPEHGRRFETEGDQEAGELLEHLDAALADEHPLALLDLVSAIVSSAEPRSRDPFHRDNSDESPSLDELVSTLLQVDNPHTTAILTTVAALSEDEIQSARIRREVAGRSHRLPTWLGRLGDPEVYRVIEMVHSLGGGDEVIIGARLPSGHEFTALMYIDHDLGTVAKDGFMVPESIDSVVELTRQAADDPDTSWNELPFADARVRVEEAIEHGAMTYPPYESETWPACRPLVEWLVRTLPGGGKGYERPEWSEADQLRLADEFFASRFGAELDDEDHRSLLGSLLWYGTDYGNGDPLRWSTVAVEILLGDWLPRKIVADAAYLALAPDLLRAFIRYAHGRSGIRDDLTDEALAVVDAMEPDYQATVRQPRPQGPEALLDAIGVLDAADWAFEEVYAESVLTSLRRAVGGDEQLRLLSTKPLPDEDVDWDSISEDVRERVDGVRRLCDACCDEFFDSEYRTACRRLLSMAAAGDPNVFRRRGKSETAAAAVCWIIGKANDAFGLYGGLQVQELLAHFGLTGSVSQRAQTMLNAAGFEWDQEPGQMDLATPDLLVSGRREQIMELRDRCLPTPAK